MAIWSPWLFAQKVVEYPRRLMCLLQWREVFRETLSYKNYALAIIVVFMLTPLVFIAILYNIIYVKLKTQTIPGEQSANANEQRVKRERNVLKMSTAIVGRFCSMLSALHCHGNCNPDCILHTVLWLSLLYGCCPDYVPRKLAINPFICLLFSKNYLQSLRNLLK